MKVGRFELLLSLSTSGRLELPCEYTVNSDVSASTELVTDFDIAWSFTWHISKAVHEEIKGHMIIEEQALGHLSDVREEKRRLQKACKSSLLKKFRNQSNTMMPLWRFPTSESAPCASCSAQVHRASDSEHDYNPLHSTSFSETEVSLSHIATIPPHISVINATKICSAMEAFGLGPETTRFLDPSARLFSILDFKNSDDVNRWGDTAAVNMKLFGIIGQPYTKSLHR